MARKEAKEYYLNMVKLYQSLGDDQKMQEYIGKLQRMEESLQKPLQQIPIEDDGEAEAGEDDDNKSVRESTTGNLDSPTTKDADDDSTSRQI